MSSSGLNSKDETLEDLLANGKKYIIPKFQRDYSWDKEHWEELWDDINAILSGEEKYHYMGYLVFKLPSDKEDQFSTPIQIIDGQQRMTTFSLLILAAIRRLNKIAGQEPWITELKSRYIGTKDMSTLIVDNKLTLNRNNDHYYKKLVEGDYISIKKVKKTVALMRNALDFFFDKLQFIVSGEQMNSVIRRLFNNLLFTTIHIISELNAYKVFETLNARGVRLSSSDLLKNFLFSLIDDNSNVSNEVLDRFDIQWEKIGTSITSNDYTDFILAEWNSRHELVRKKELFRCIRIEIKNGRMAEIYLKDLESKSEIYAALLSPDDEFWIDYVRKDDIKRMLSVLKLFNITQPISLLLSAIVTFNQNEFLKILSWITVLSIRYNVICRKHTGEQERLYNKLCLMIQKGDTVTQIKDEIKKFCPDDNEFESDFSNKSFPAEKSNKRAKFLLARLEEKMTNFSQPIDETRLTVEHILPINPDEVWEQYFDEHWSSYNQCLGNLALVTENDNRKLDQSKFEEKKKLLANTTFKINQNIKEFSEWSPSAIESRQKDLAKTAIQLWRIE